MKLGLIATAAVAAIAFGAETASAQVVIRHGGHHHHMFPVTPVRPAFVTPAPGFGFARPASPSIIGFGSIQPSFIQPSFIQPSFFGGPVLVPHTTTHMHLVPHRGHFHAVPHTTTHFHLRR